MRVFISFATKDADLAAEVEGALRQRSIETASRLDVTSGDDWKRLMDRESANANAFLFLIGSGAPVDAQLRSEWRALLRNDWDSSKPLILYVHDPSGELPGEFRGRIPPFLRSRKPIVTTNYDTLVDELQHAVAHPEDSIDREQEEIGKLEREKRLGELRDYALALKQETGDIRHK